MDKNLTDYINSALEQKISKAQIEANLRKGGWTESEIDEAFKQILNPGLSGPSKILSVQQVQILDYKSIAIFLSLFDFFAIFKSSQLLSSLSTLRLASSCYLQTCSEPSVQFKIILGLMVLLTLIALPAFIAISIINKNLKLAMLVFLVSGVEILIQDLTSTSSYFFLSHLLSNVFPVSLSSPNLPLFFFLLLNLFLIFFKFLGEKLKIAKYSDKFFTYLLIILFIYTSLFFVKTNIFYKINSKIFAPVNNYIYKQVRKSILEEQKTKTPQIPKFNYSQPQSF